MTPARLEHHIREALTQITSRDASAVPPDVDLRDALGLDSLGRLELLAEIEDLLDAFFLETGREDSYSISGFLDIAAANIDLDMDEVA